MGTMRGEQLIAESFKRENVDTIFFMMGGPTSGTAAACLDLGMQGIYVRHEQAAAMMAHAYARVTGKPGICITPVRTGHGQCCHRAGQCLGGCCSDYCYWRRISDAGDNTRRVPGDGSTRHDEAGGEGGVPD